MKRWGCAALAVMLAGFTLGCGAGEGESAQYQAGYDDGFRVGFARGQEEAAKEPGGQEAGVPSATATRPRQTSTPTPFVAVTPTMPILIDPTPTPRETETPDTVQGTPLFTGEVKGAQVNMRSGPGTEYAVVYEVGQYAQVEIYGIEEGWYRARAGGVEGYIHMDLLTLRYAGPLPAAAREPSYVWVRASGSSYHAVSDCGYTNPSASSLVSLAEAKRRGLVPCAVCFAETTPAAVWLDAAADYYHSFGKCGELHAGGTVEVPLSAVQQLGIPPCEVCRPPV